MSRLHLPNLDGVRALAALLVFAHHVELTKDIYGLPNRSDVPFFATAGKLGVVLFFVLSGFLITYLLMVEQKQTGTIALRRFYLRRVLRIWPLYFLIVLSAFFVLPYITAVTLPGFDLAFVHKRLGIKLLLFVFLLPNLAGALGAVPYAAQVWSIGTEEQFYLMWPALLRRAKNKYLVILGVIVGYFAVQIGLSLVASVTTGRAAPAAAALWRYFAVDCMAIGGLVALLAIQDRQAILRILHHPVVQVATWITVIVLLACGAEFGPVHYEVYAILFAILISNLATNPKTVVRLENPVLNYIGKISYGFYMYHPLGIVIAYQLLLRAGVHGDVALYSASLAMSLAMAAVSFRWFEGGFLRLKERFAFGLKDSKDTEGAPPRSAGSLSAPDRTSTS